MTETADDRFAADDEPEEASTGPAERFARYQRQRNGGHLTPRQIRRLVRKGGTCGWPAEDGTICFHLLDHDGPHETSTGPWYPWPGDSYGGEHSPADEYLIYPEVRTCYGDTYAY
jgi:hypothetical protein